MPDEEGEPLSEWVEFRRTNEWWGVFRTSEISDDDPPEAIFSTRADAEKWMAAMVADDEEGKPGPEDCFVAEIKCLGGIYKNG